MKTAALRYVTILITTLTLGFSVLSTALASEESDDDELQQYNTTDEYNTTEGTQTDGLQRTANPAEHNLESGQDEYDEETKYEEEWTDDDMEED